MNTLTNHALRVLALALLATLSLLSTVSCDIIRQAQAPPVIHARIFNKSNIPIFHGKAPIILALESQEGFASRAANYTVELTKEHCTPLRLSLSYLNDSWEWERKRLGGRLQLLAADCSTGAVYKLDDRYVNTLFTSTDGLQDEKPKIVIHTLESVPESWRQHLVAIYTPAQMAPLPLAPH